MRAPQTLRFSSSPAERYAAPSTCSGASRARRALRVAGAVAVLLVFSLAVVLVTLRLLGCTPFAVLSGSMEPAYPVGSLIYVRAVEGSKLHPGDPVTFVADEQGTVATHRVVSVDADAEVLVTQGDANDAPDGSPVAFENVIGRPFMCIPGAGYAAVWMMQPPGSFVVIALLVGVAAWAFVPRADRSRSRAVRAGSRREGGRHGFR